MKWCIHTDLWAQLTRKKKKTKMHNFPHAGFADWQISLWTVRIWMFICLSVVFLQVGPAFCCDTKCHLTKTSMYC